MKLENSTSYPALLVRAGIDAETMLGAAVARVTYDIVGEALRPAEEQAWGVSLPPWDSEYGQMPGDELFYREGVDVMVFGAARSPRGQTLTRSQVEVRLGARWRGRVLVFGDRVWRSVRGGLVPGPPQPFRAIPLDLAHAFGGDDEWDGLKVPFPDNPQGKGFYLSAESAVDRPLPNLEDPAAPVQRWDDRPEPVGTGAALLQFGPRMRRGLEVDEQTQAIARINPILFNAAFPQMIAPAAAPGDRVVVTGVREDGPLVFTLPPNPLLLRVRFDAEVHERVPAIEQIGIEADRRRVFITYRHPFRYTLVRMQKRSCELLHARR